MTVDLVAPDVPSTLVNVLAVSAGVALGGLTLKALNAVGDYSRRALCCDDEREPGWCR